MNKLRLIIGISIILNPVLLVAQNWQRLGVGVNYSTISLFADTINNKIYAGKNLMGSGLNGLDVWDGGVWDTLSFVQTSVYKINKFQGDIIVANGDIRKWNGTNWVNLASTTAGAVLGLYNDNDNNLYVTGWIDTIDGIPASKIAKWDGVSWSAIDTSHWGGGASVCSIIYKGDLYVGGNFGNNTRTIDRIARWDGSLWHSVGNGMPGGDAIINCFEIYNNELYVAGRFYASSGCPGNSIAKWDGVQWSDVGGGFSDINPTLYDLKVFDGELYASGIFDTVGGVPIKDIAKWNGTNWCGLGFNPVGLGRGVLGLDVLNNELYIGGGFKDINNDTMNYVAKWTGGSFVDVCGNTTGIDETIIEKEKLHMYPNPATNQITIEFEPTREECLIEIKNVLGEIVYSAAAKNVVGKQAKSIDVSGFSNGVYFLQVQIGGSVLNKKFVKQ
jgi:hypothetical protein